MLSSSFPCEFVQFLRRSMGCFFSCFRVKDDHRPQEPVDPLASNCLWSVLVSEDEDSDHSQLEDGRCGVTGSPGLDDELRAEAKFLKACGTLLQTPAEFRNTEKSKELQRINEDTESTFHSWLPNTTTENTSENQTDQLQSPIKLFTKWENGSDSSESCGVERAIEDTEYTPIVASTQYKTKSVHFESQIDKCSFSSSGSSSKITKEPLKPSESPFDNNTLSKPSPYPTPLKLTDDMPTPGTVFPSYIYNKDSGNNQKIRFQYVYSGINTDNFSQLKASIEEDFSSEETPASQVILQENTSENDHNASPTLSSWLSPKSNYEDCIDQSLAPISLGVVDFGQGQSPGDRPILGVVAANWNAEETSFTPKLWNGIPNTTNKYKEDQKVNWHATPFEKRLEKALLEEKCIPKRKQLEETEF